MDLITVLVGGLGTTELILPRDLSVIGGLSVRRGDDVDFIIDIQRSERGFNLAILGVYSEEDALSAVS
jgi:hypothetical protein